MTTSTDQTSYSKLSDAELVTQIIAGNANLYAQLVERYQDKILRYLHYFTQEYELAQDATQAAFVKAYVNLNSYQLDQKFSSWLYRIAHNEAINLLRQQKSSFSLESFSNSSQLSTADQLDPLEKLVSQEQITTLQHALKKLSSVQQQVILLYYLENKSYDEIADIIKTNKNSVGSHLNRAKKKLFKLIKK